VRPVEILNHRGFLRTKVLGPGREFGVSSGKGPIVGAGHCRAVPLSPGVLFLKDSHTPRIRSQYNETPTPFVTQEPRSWRTVSTAESNPTEYRWNRRLVTKSDEVAEHGSPIAFEQWGVGFGKKLS